MKNIKLKTIVGSFLLTLAACGKGNIEVIDNVSKSVVGGVGCENPQVKTFNGLFKVSEKTNQLPSYEEMLSAIEENLYKLHPEITTNDRDLLNVELAELYKLLTIEADKVYSAEKGYSLKRKLATIELGLKETPEQEELSNKIELQWNKIQSLAKQANADCNTLPDDPTEDTPNPTPPNSDPIPKPDLKKVSAIDWGSYKVFSTLYQSCDSLNVSHLNKTTPAVQGIKKVGTHSSGGTLRDVEDAKLIMKTNPYLTVNKANSVCRDLSNTPPIYDFGGKPASTNDLIDLFTNDGSGTNALGIDCSGYVSASYLAAGLKLSNKAPIRASQTGVYSSRSFLDPKKAGLTCFQNIVFTPKDQIKSGDIAAVDGHVVLLEVNNSDPFGISKITKESDCAKTVINIDKFNFIISQSSASKNGIGVNRYIAKDYLKENSKIQPAFIEYAIAACKAKVRNKNQIVKPTVLNIIRHTGASDCKAQPVGLVASQCTESCLPSLGQITDTIAPATTSDL